MVVASATTHVRTRLGRDLSRFGKIALLVWALETTGEYPRAPFEMAFVYALCGVAVLAAVALAARVRVTSPKKLRASRVTLDEGRVVIERDGRRFEFGARDVDSAHSFDGASEVRMRDGDVWGFVHASAADADAFVRALGFGLRGRRATFDLALPASISTRVGSAGVALFVAACVTFPLAGLEMPTTANTLRLVLAALLYELFRYNAKKPIVTAGVDGVAIAYRRRTQFVPARDIAGASRAEPSGNTIIVRKNAPPIEIHGPNEFRQAALAARVAALAANESPPAPVALAREGRSVRAWREHLRDAVTGGYRVAAGPLDALADQIVSSDATPEQRVGAALALRVADADGASRVRVAAAHCADARLREALEAAAAQEIDDAELERALDRLAK